MDTPKELNLSAAERGGTCLSNIYDRAHSKYEWQYSAGNHWKAKWVSVKSGAWCRKCADAERGRKKAEANFARVKAIIATDHPDAILLSEKYVDQNTPLLIQCERGHLWDGLPKLS